MLCSVEIKDSHQWIVFLLLQKNVHINYCEAECVRIDAENKKVYCRSNLDNTLDGIEEFVVDFDYLVISVGARSNTFNIPGVEENTLFLKVIARIFLKALWNCYSFFSDLNLTWESNQREVRNLMSFSK